jgi:hypothetical protein
MQWLNMNAGAIQALTAIAITLLTAALIGVTWWYAGLTQQMAKTMQQQMVAAFQPSVGLIFSLRTTGRNSTPTGTEDSIGGFVRCVNNGQQPVKIVSLMIDVTFADGAFPNRSMTIDGENLILAPASPKEFVFAVVVPQTAIGIDHTRHAKLWCSDLAGVSQHTFEMNEGDTDITHYLGFK